MSNILVGLVGKVLFVHLNYYSMEFMATPYTKKDGNVAFLESVIGTTSSRFKASDLSDLSSEYVPLNVGMMGFYSEGVGKSAPQNALSCITVGFLRRGCNEKLLLTKAEINLGPESFLTVELGIVYIQNEVQKSDTIFFRIEFCPKKLSPR